MQELCNSSGETSRTHWATMTRTMRMGTRFVVSLPALQCRCSNSTAFVPFVFVWCWETLGLTIGTFESASRHVHDDAVSCPVSCPFVAPVLATAPRQAPDKMLPKQLEKHTFLDLGQPDRSGKHFSSKGRRQEAWPNLVGSRVQPRADKPQAVSTRRRRQATSTPHQRPPRANKPQAVPATSHEQQA